MGIRVWHGGCPNMSGQVRFLPGLEVMSREFFDWQQAQNAAKGKAKGKVTRLARRLLPQELYANLPERIQQYCREIVAAGHDLVNRKIDDTTWLRRELIAPPRDSCELWAAQPYDPELWAQTIQRKMGGDGTFSKEDYSQRDRPRKRARR